MEHADRIARAASMSPVRFPTSTFDIVGYLRAGDLRAGDPESRQLRVYIEGDGFAWRTRSQPSDDPTPKDPVGLRLAAADTGPDAVLYLARPCQYAGAGQPPCSPRFWTEARFSEDVIAATSEAIADTQRDLGLPRAILFGFSGGGVVALLAATRIGGVRVVTVAAPLDHAAWTTLHRVTPLLESLSPRELASDLRSIPQTHFAGERDRVVPPEVIRSYAEALGAPEGLRVIVEPGFSHTCCWVEEWERLLGATLP